MLSLLQKTVKIPLKACIQFNSTFQQPKYSHVDSTDESPLPNLQQSSQNNVKCDNDSESYNNLNFCEIWNLKTAPKVLPDSPASAQPLEPITDAFFQPAVKKKPTVTRSIKVFSVLPDSEAETQLVDSCLSNSAENSLLKNGISSGDSLLCLFNPGFSNLPKKFIQSGDVRRILILDSAKKSCDYWRKFKKELASNDVQFNVEQLDFTHIANQSAIDLKKSQPNSFAEVLKKHGCSPEKSEIDSQRPPSVVFAGVAPFFKERPLAISILQNRLHSSVLFDFGRVDFLLYVSASKYMVLDQQCPVIFGACKARRQIYSTFFDVKTVAKVPFASNFLHEPNIDKGQYKQFLEKNQVDVSKAYLMHLRPKADSEIPLLIKPFPASSTSNVSSPTLPNDVTKTFIHFEYFNRQLYHNTKSVGDFVENLFPGAQEFLAEKDATREECKVEFTKSFLKKKAKSLNQPEELALFDALRQWTGYETSPFFGEAESFVDSTYCPEYLL